MLCQNLTPPYALFSTQVCIVVYWLEKLLVVEQKTNILIEESKTIIKVSTTIFHTCFIESRNCNLQFEKRKTVVYKNCIMLHIFKLNRFQPNYTCANRAMNQIELN